LHAPPASADATSDGKAVGKFTWGQVQRVRRTFAIGPQVGGFSGYHFGTDTSVVALTVGVGFYAFKVPSVLNVAERIDALVRERLEAHLKAVVESGGQPPADKTSLIEEITADIKAELAGKPPPRRTLERPRWGAVIETAFFRGGGFQTRVVWSMGFGPMSIGGALAAQRSSGDTVLVPGLEASVRLLPLGQQWTPVFELYARGDVPLADETALVGVGGVRATLDLF
jgi:hypothetical protein